MANKLEPDFLDVVKLLKDVGFLEIESEGSETGYRRIFNSRDIEVYLKGGYINIHQTPTLLKLEIYKRDGYSLYYHGSLSQYGSWYMAKKMMIKKDAIEVFRDFLLLSICRDSFLDPEEEETSRIRRSLDYDEITGEWFL